MKDAGFQDLGKQDIGIAGTVERGFFAPNGDLFALIYMGPDAFDTDELASAKSSVPAGSTVMLLLYLPQ
jgi:hypothetical protein